MGNKFIKTGDRVMAPGPVNFIIKVHEKFYINTTWGYKENDLNVNLKHRLLPESQVDRHSDGPYQSSAIQSKNEYIYNISVSMQSDRGQRLTMVAESFSLSFLSSVMS